MHAVTTLSSLWKLKWSCRVQSPQKHELNAIPLRATHVAYHSSRKDRPGILDPANRRGSEPMLVLGTALTEHLWVFLAQLALLTLAFIALLKHARPWQVTLAEKKGKKKHNTMRIAFWLERPTKAVQPNRCKIQAKQKNTAAKRPHVFGQDRICTNPRWGYGVSVLVAACHDLCSILICVTPRKTNTKNKRLASTVTGGATYTSVNFSFGTKQIWSTLEAWVKGSNKLIRLMLTPD